MSYPIWRTATLVALIALVGCNADSGGGGGSCGADTCPLGCCDPVTGTCQQGTAATACGTGGQTCLACTGGYTCDATTRICGPGGTGTCTPQTCQGGCCSPQGICVQPGNYASACGIDGLACKVCVGSDQCVNGQCQGYDPELCNATNCPTGCCLGDQCQPYPNASQCGIRGAPCQPCPASYTCNTQTGQCQDPSGCGTPCQQQDGCCLNNQCQPGTHPMACGGGGQICDTCNQDEVCENKQCVPANQTGNCTPFNCPTGCCDNQGRCHLDGAINEQFCGALGLGCDVCQTWEECTWGNCNPKETTCSCGPGQCCSNGSCVPGNTQTSCGTNGQICDNCLLKLPPTTCNTTTYTCGGGGTTTCTGCTSTQCCNTSTGQCVTGTSNTQCGSNGVTCQSCGGQTCTYDTSSSSYTCGGTSSNYRVCLNYVDINCPSFPDCYDDSVWPAEIYVEFTIGGSTIDSAKASFDTSGGDQQLAYTWCSTQSFPASDLASIPMRVMEYDYVGTNDPIGSCTATPTVPSDFALVVVCQSGLSVAIRVIP